MDQVLWDALKLYDFPKVFPMYATKCFFEVDEIDVELPLPFCALFNDISQDENLVNAAFILSKILLAPFLVNYIAIDCFRYSF